MKRSNHYDEDSLLLNKYTHQWIIIHVCVPMKRTYYRGLLLTRKLLIQGFLVAKLKSSLGKFSVCHLDLVNRYGVSLSQLTTDMFCSVLSSFVTCHRVCNKSTRRVSLVERELLNHPKHSSSTTGFSGVNVAQSL